MRALETLISQQHILWRGKFGWLGIRRQHACHEDLLKFFRTSGWKSLKKVLFHAMKLPQMWLSVPIYSREACAIGESRPEKI